MTFVNEKGKKIGESRTIDYGRNIVLTTEEHDRENNYIFNLSIDGVTFTVLANLDWRPSENGGANLSWKISRIDYPESHSFNRELLLQILKEAMETYGIRHSKNGIDEINIEFSSTI